MTDNTLWVPPGILGELMFYAWEVNAEVGGLGCLEFDDDKNITISEIFLLEQTAHDCECELSAEGIAKLFQELIENGEGDKIEKINFWWHSHKNMGVGFSGTDEKMLEDWNGSYLVALVINRDGDMKAKVMTRTPVFMTAEIKPKIDWFDVPQRQEWKEAVDTRVVVQKPVVHVKAAENKEIVAIPKTQTPMTPYKYYNQYGRYGYDWERDWEYDYMGNRLDKRFHSMTDEEFAKAQEDIDEGVKALLATGVVVMDSDEMDEWEAEAIKKMWQAEAES